MPTTVDVRTGIQQLDRDECVRLLALDNVGRLAVITGDVPMVFPVNYCMDGDAVVFRTDPGTKLDQGRRARVAFEIDQLDRTDHTGWSVVVTGWLDEVTQYDAKTLHRVTALDVQPWAGGAKDHWVRVVPERITGRRIVHPR